MKIDPREYEAFRQTLPEALRGEVYHFLHVSFDVTLARFLIHKGNLVPTPLGVELWATNMQLNWPEGRPNDAHLMNGVSDSLALKENIDPKIPVIVIEFAWKKGGVEESMPFMIDGHKRLRKAFVQKLENIPAYYIPKEIARCIYDKTNVHSRRRR